MFSSSPSAGAGAAPAGPPAGDALVNRLSDLATRGSSAALLLVGVDNFRAYNALHGRPSGDALLGDVGRHLEMLLAGRPGMVARAGGDTFLILLESVDAGQAVDIGGEVVARVREQGARDDRSAVTVSVGIAPLAVGEGGSDPAPQLMLEADQALQRAKDAGRDRVALYTAAVGRDAGAEASWGLMVRDAVRDGRLRLLCQPVRSLHTGNTEQWELLVRLDQSDGYLLPPRAMLPLAERYGVLEELDRWVVGQAIDLIEASCRQGRDLRLEINISSRSVADPRLLELVRSRLPGLGLDPGNLIFEISEPTTMHHFDQVADLAGALHRMGCRFALDNFGTGTGSLLHMSRLPLDYLKIDGSLIRHVLSNERDRALVRGVVGLARELGQQTVATFVADDPTLDALRSDGVDYAQGYHVGMPTSIEALR